MYEARSCGGRGLVGWFAPRETDARVSCIMQENRYGRQLPGRRGPASSTAGSGLSWMDGWVDGWGERGARVPPTGQDWFDLSLEPGGPPIWATSIARSRGRRLDGLAKARSGTGGAGQITSSGRQQDMLHCRGGLEQRRSEGEPSLVGRRDRDMTGGHGD